MTTSPPTSPSAENASPGSVHWSAHATLWCAAVVVGLVTSVGVWLFLQGFALINALTFGTVGSLPAPAGWLAAALIPMLGGLLVAVLMHYLSHPAPTAAMAHIINGAVRDGGRVDLRNGAAFVAASLVGIGFGAPVGADTPAALIGGHFGSWLSQRLHWREDFVRALVVAGVGAGIAATYLAQLSAVFFALEVVLGGVGGAVFVIPTLIAVVASTLFTTWAGGTPPRYDAATGSDPWGLSLLLYVGVALLAAVAAIAYVNLLPRTRALWLRIELPFWTKTALAGLLVGLVGIWLPDIFGTGLNQMKAIFSGTVYPLQMLLLLAFAKLVLTPNSLGAGFAGGVIGPALLIGSWLGAAYGTVVVQLFPGVEVSPVALAMVATAAMLAATFHAPLFGTMMMFEMSGDLHILAPLGLGAALAYGIARLFQPGSAYTFGFRSLGLRLVPGRFTAERVDPTAKT